MGNEADILAAVVQSIQNFQVENRAAFNRIHERIDQLLNRDYVERQECEKYRLECQKCMKEKIEKVTGWPPWVTVVSTVLTALVISMGSYIIMGK